MLSEEWIREGQRGYGPVVGLAVAGIFGGGRRLAHELTEGGYGWVVGEITFPALLLMLLLDPVNLQKNEQ